MSDEPSRLDLAIVQKLVRIMKRAELAEVEVDDTKNGLRVHLRRDGGDSGASPLVNVMQGSAVPAALPQPGPASPGAAPAAAAAPAPVEGAQPFPSPMVGTFYRSASPDSEPFVEAGAAVDEDTTICIIEAMKVMNEIKAEMRAEIVEVLVANGEPVEFGQPLFLVKPR